MNVKKFFSRDKTERYDSGDYKTENSRRSMIIIAVISLALAIIIWSVAVYVDSDTREYTSVKIEVRNAEKLGDDGIRVILEEETVSFTVTGRKSVVNALSDTSVIAYVDLSEADVNAERDKLKVKFEYEGKLQISNVSADTVAVQIIDAWGSDD